MDLAALLVLASDLRVVAASPGLSGAVVTK